MSEDKTLLYNFSGLKFSQIKNCDITDLNGKKIGRLIDAVFRKSSTGLDLTKFVVGGSRWEEMLEDLKIKKDVDPVFPVSLIDSISPKRIKLKVERSELKSTAIDLDAIETDEIKLSGLSKMKLYDDQKEHIGNIIDVKFYDQSFKFIVGDGFFQELIEDLGLAADIDYLLNPEFVSEITHKAINLTTSKANMKSTFDKHMPELKQIEAKTRSKSDLIGGSLYLP